MIQRSDNELASVKLSEKWDRCIDYLAVNG